MTIHTKFNKGDTVYIPCIKIVKATVLGINITIGQTFPVIKYTLSNSDIPYVESVLFATEDELLKHFDY